MVLSVALAAVFVVAGPGPVRVANAQSGPGPSRNLLNNGSWERGDQTGWTRSEQSTTAQAIQLAGSAREGSWFERVTVAVANGSIYQDVPVAPLPNTSHTL